MKATERFAQTGRTTRTLRRAIRLARDISDKGMVLVLVADNREEDTERKLAEMLEPGEYALLNLRVVRFSNKDLYVYDGEKNGLKMLWVLDHSACELNQSFMKVLDSYFSFDDSEERVPENPESLLRQLKDHVGRILVDEPDHREEVQHHLDSLRYAISSANKDEDLLCLMESEPKRKIPIRELEFRDLVA